MKKIYLITGASSDVGTAFIRRVWNENDVFIAQGSGDTENIEIVKKELGDNIYIYDVNLTSKEALENFANEISEKFDTPTHFIHLPALRVINTKFKKFDEERFELDLNVQVHSAVYLCKKFMPLMAKAKYGRVLFMLTSYLIGVPPKNTAAYIMAKNAIAGLAKSLAIDYASFGVTVNCVMPSMMETKFLQDTSNLIVEASAQDNPMKRNARVSDVVPAMEFLTGDEAGFITGVVLPITGGSAMM